MEELFTNFNGWTIAGIICAFLTYFFIQKGSIVNATKIKNELKTEIDGVQENAIKAIDETTKQTIEKIKSSSNEIISDLEDKSTELNKSLNQLKEETDKQTLQIKENTDFHSKKTQKLIGEEAGSTRQEVKTSRKSILSGQVNLKDKITAETDSLKIGQKTIESGISDLSKGIGKNELLEFDFRHGVSLSKANQLSFYIQLNNKSNIPGTELKINFAIYGKELKGISTPKLIDYDIYFRWGENPEGHNVIPNIDIKEYHWYSYTTNDKFKERILYPNDKLTIMPTCVRNDKLADVNYVILGTSCWIKEAKRVTKYTLVNLNGTSQKQIVMEVDESNFDKLLIKYNELI